MCVLDIGPWGEISVWDESYGRDRDRFEGVRDGKGERNPHWRGESRSHGLSSPMQLMGKVGQVRVQIRVGFVSDMSGFGWARPSRGYGSG